MVPVPCKVVFSSTDAYLLAATCRRPYNTTAAKHAMQGAIYPPLRSPFADYAHHGFQRTVGLGEARQQQAKLPQGAAAKEQCWDSAKLVSVCAMLFSSEQPLHCSGYAWRYDKQALRTKLKRLGQT